METINRFFVPVQANTQADDGKMLVAKYRQAWTPDIRVLGVDGFEYAAWIGYLPPAEYVPQLLVARATALLRMQENVAAADAYSEVLDRFPTSQAAPEAAYFFAVSKYKESHEPADLRGRHGWHRLQTRYPESTWRLRQSWTEEE